MPISAPGRKPTRKNMHTRSTATTIASTASANNHTSVRLERRTLACWAKKSMESSVTRCKSRLRRSRQLALYSSRGSASDLRKTHLRRFPLRRIVDRKLLGRCESERSRYQRRGKHLRPVVVVHHRIVVRLARERDAVFGGSEFLRQLHHVLVGLEIRVRFADREQATERLGQLILAAGQLL